MKERLLRERFAGGAACRAQAERLWAG